MGIFLIERILSESYTHLLNCEEIGYPSLKFNESDLYRSTGPDSFLLNQKCFFASAAVNLYHRFFRSLSTRSLADLPNSSQITSSNSMTPFSIFCIVSKWH